MWSGASILYACVRVIDVHSVRGRQHDGSEITVDTGTWKNKYFPCLLVHQVVFKRKHTPHWRSDRPPSPSSFLAITAVRDHGGHCVCGCNGIRRTCSYGTAQPQRLGSPVQPARTRSGYDRRQSVASELGRKAKRAEGLRGRECTGTSSSFHNPSLSTRGGEKEAARGLCEMSM